MNILTTSLRPAGLNGDWAGVAAYLTAAALCGWAAFRERRRGIRVVGLASWFWLALAGVLVLLGVARQWGLGPWLTDLGREIARSEGWYPRRRPIQADAIKVVLLFGAFALTVGAATLLPVSKRHLLAFAATDYLVCFFLVRAISLHGVDSLLYGHPVIGVRLNSVLELGGTLAVALVAFATVLAASRVPVARSPVGGAFAVGE